jgi:hypothetical protein
MSVACMTHDAVVCVVYKVMLWRCALDEAFVLTTSVHMSCSYIYE